MTMLACTRTVKVSHQTGPPKIWSIARKMIEVSCFFILFYFVSYYISVVPPYVKQLPPMPKCLFSIGAFSIESYNSLMMGRRVSQRFLGKWHLAPRKRQFLTVSIAILHDFVWLFYQIIVSSSENLGTEKQRHEMLARLLVI